MSAKSFKRILAAAAVFTVVVMSFAFFASAAIQRDSVVLPLRRLTYYWYNGSNFTSYAGYQTSVSDTIHIDLGLSQSSIFQIYIDGLLTSFIPDNATSAWLEFDVSVSSEAIKGNGDFPPFYGADRVQFCEDLSTGSVVQLSSILASQTDVDGDPYIVFWYKYKEKNGNTRLVDLSAFSEWINVSDSANPYITFSVLVQFSPSVLEQYRSSMSRSNIVRVLCDHSTTAGGYLDISPVVTMLYTYDVITPEDQYNQMNDLINGTSDVQDQYGDLSSDDSALNSDLDSILNDFKSQVGGDLNDGLSDILPNITNFSGDFLPQLWACMFQNSDGVNPEPGGTYLFQFACVGLFSTVMFFLLRV